MSKLIKITNKRGMSVICSTMGGGIYDIMVPDKDGNIESVLVRPNSTDDYDYADGHYGKPAGRTAGRIRPKTVTLDENTFTIKTVNPKADFALHGGLEGFSEKEFEVSEKTVFDDQSLVFTYLSKDGESGYPGNLKVTIRYILRGNENRLLIEHEATTDKKTLCNLTCHAYFNLSGNNKRNILNQELYLNSSRYGVVDKETVATCISKVDENFDFRNPHKIGDFIEQKEVQKFTYGYDHPFLLDGNMPAAILCDKESGRELTIDTNYESCVMYSCNWPDHFINENGKYIQKYDGICLEMQHFPNTVHSSFIHDKKDVLAAGQKYDQFIEYTFSII